MGVNSLRCFPELLPVLSCLGYAVKADDSNQEIWIWLMKADDSNQETLGFAYCQEAPKFCPALPLANSRKSRKQKIEVVKKFSRLFFECLLQSFYLPTTSRLPHSPCCHRRKSQPASPFCHIPQCCTLQYRISVPLLPHCFHYHRDHLRAYQVSTALI